MSDLSVLTPDWPAPARVRALVTTRRGGVGVAPFDDFNLADHVGDEPARVAANRRLLRAHLPGEPMWLEQVHGAEVVAGEPEGTPPRADAAFSRTTGSVCAVLTADCLPVLLCDRAGSVVAAAHAGWRGLAAGVLENAVRAMSVAPGNLLAWLGPAIGPDAFEVGEEVRETFVRAQPDARSAFVAGGRRGKWMADLYRLARLRLAASGVSAVYGGGLCTYSDVDRFFSYRRDGRTGRQASLIWLDAG